MALLLLFGVGFGFKSSEFVLAVQPVDDDHAFAVHLHFLLDVGLDLLDSFPGFQIVLLNRSPFLSLSAFFLVIM